jgi:hypothetical protein
MDARTSSVPAIRGDSLAACRVVVATADRSVTAPAQEGTYAHRQTQTSASNACGGDSVRDRTTEGGARTPSVRATTFTSAQNKNRLASLRGGDSRGVCDVGLATADSGGTAPAHVGMHARRQTQTPPAPRGKARIIATAWWTDPTDVGARPPSTSGDDVHPGTQKKPTRFAATGELTRRSPCLTGHRRRWRNCARARQYARTKADSDAGAGVERVWQLPDDGGARSPSVPV